MSILSSAIDDKLRNAGLPYEVSPEQMYGYPYQCRLRVLKTTLMVFNCIGIVAILFVTSGLTPKEQKGLVNEAHPNLTKKANPNLTEEAVDIQVTPRMWGIVFIIALSIVVSVLGFFAAFGEHTGLLMIYGVIMGISSVCFLLLLRVTDFMGSAIIVVLVYVLYDNIKEKRTYIAGLPQV